MSQGCGTKAVIRQREFKQYTPSEQLIAVLFGSDDVIRDEVENSVFAGSTNKGVAEVQPASQW